VVLYAVFLDEDEDEDEDEAGGVYVW